MNIVLAGSMAFVEKMQLLKEQFEKNGSVVTLPQDGGDMSPTAIRGYNDTALKRIVDADALVVVNETKHDVSGYVGANTLVEIGMAFALHKPVYVLNDYDRTQPNAVELAGLVDGIVGEDIEKWLKEAMK